MRPLALVAAALLAGCGGGGGDEQVVVLAAPFVFASNRLVIVVPRENRAQVEHIADLTREGVELVLAAEGVPVGDYARESLELAGLGAALENVVSLETDVTGVLSKVTLDEADAGIVYATDATAAGDEVLTIAISEHFQPEIRYFAAAVAPGSDAADEYIDRLSSEEGQRVLREAGFLPVPQ
jgi:molybdate transport system substrate-binding protein